MQKDNNKEKIERQRQVAREQFVAELLKRLNTEDYSASLLQSVNDACGFAKNYYQLLFEGKELEVANFVEQHHDEMMLEALKSNKDIKKIREKIAAALISRIINVTSKEVALRQSAFFLMPQNVLAGMENACRTCDAIWRFAGDKSTDFNYYTKRGLLLPVYMSAKTFYFADDSENNEATKKFIRGALDNIVNIASLKSRINPNITIPKLEDIPILRMFL